MAESKDSDKKAKTPKKGKPSAVKTKDSDSDDDSSTTTNASIESAPRRNLYLETDQIGKGVATGAISVNREEYLLAYRELTFDKNRLQIKNNILHRRLAEYYKKRKLEHVLKPINRAIDLEEKYEQKLYGYEDLKNKEAREMAEIATKLEEVDRYYNDRLESAEKTFNVMQELERSTGYGLIYSKKGKPIAEKTVERLLKLQRHKSEQSSALRLRYIRARNAVADLEDTVRKLECLGPGLYVAHYEQLFIDNQNYLNKIEEREDELIKNRVKCTEHNQILAHIREKMHHTDEMIDFAECDLGDVEIDYYKAREELGHVKSRRDKLRWDLDGERCKAGLLTRRDLLRDFQDAADNLVELREKKAVLEVQISKTAQRLRDARRSIRLQQL